ncbi:hypothetical protein JHS95_23630 [Vibrio parahaemolyticus]|uniref:hypothetical protein n=1 Tax=Vibrio parahaemolyticus TaxID=670 RepID=UPI001B82599D|nr:hypothetical protein [Vibrio parahaemolyticus]UJW96478.1 hypothetical protein JHS95_23630 [Vibrio parahaemolyticus]HBB9944295.1 hypothetical protein [Vibrio parahaemolyticus]HBC3416766.1 hypothetical protein [Vibrio parahaemolyticus]HBC3602248.1 hypothetical protein [Vibrio parahaemolyticus]HBC3878318.1 hypothetical protein [Vibrio parahaemolyticus]
MKNLTLAIIASFGLLSNTSMANETPISDVTNYETVMQTLNKVCPTCELSLSSMLEAMNQQCGFPLTEENVKFVASSHPVYAFSMAANSMLAGNENVKQSFNKALVDNVNCWDAQIWIESTKDAMSDD